MSTEHSLIIGDKIDLLKGDDSDFILRITRMFHDTLDGNSLKMTNEEIVALNNIIGLIRSYNEGRPITFYKYEHYKYLETLVDLIKRQDEAIRKLTALCRSANLIQPDSASDEGDHIPRIK